MFGINLRYCWKKFKDLLIKYFKIKQVLFFPKVRIRSDVFGTLRRAQFSKLFLKH